MKKLLPLLLFITTIVNATIIEPTTRPLPIIEPTPPTIELTTITFSQFYLDVKYQSYLRPNGNSQYDEGLYAYDLARFTVDTSGDYTIKNTHFDAAYVGVDEDYTTNESYNFIAPNTPSWKADTMIYVYDEVPNILTPTNPLYFADNDDNPNYDGEDSDGDLLFSLTGTLEAETDYWAIITTFDPKVVGYGSLEITGPGAVDITVIPEPSTYALMVAFGGFLAMAIRKRNK